MEFRIRDKTAFKDEGNYFITKELIDPGLSIIVPPD